ncbi:hypothetical protein QAD02_001795 [Eretmocerus hayati]|uniref:Uncharacterized protein n=1 Tax=Eretmocerus hayati TaxID=131215 RepID=A0ACC2NHG6_9HYME|nr:hypothetical protein QAD02_001795 [Eretmocerus hayati]
MARSATAILLTMILLLLTIFVWSGGGALRHRHLRHQNSYSDEMEWSQLRQIVTRNISGVRLEEPRATGGSLLEIIEEQTCSASLVRLTCRSLEAFVFVLEAEYQPERSDACVLRDSYVSRENWCKLKRRLANARLLQTRRDFLIYRYGLEDPERPYDFRTSVNRRCSGLHHCRYRVLSDHPEALFWKPANIRIKYACIPETSVYKYCNTVIRVPNVPGGFLKSPGYPLYYLGGFTCEWSFRSRPDQRILLTFHDLSIRDHDKEGRCVDIVRISDSGETLFQSCGTMAGVKVISKTNVIALNLIADVMLYPARGFFLQYQGTWTFDHLFLLEITV